MKMSPEEKRVSEAMAAGNISREGFLGEDTRSLPDIIQGDEAEMARLGLDFDETAAILGRLLEEGEKALGAPAAVDGRFRVELRESRGLIPCPYRDGRFRKGEVMVTRLDSGKSLTVTALSLHLFSAHHFLQGRGAGLRLDPALLKETLF